MSMTQFKGNDNAHGAALERRVREIRGYIERSVREACPVHEVEQALWEQLLKFGHEALDLYFSLQGTGDQGEVLTLPDGRRVRRLPGIYPRPYRSIFGAFTLERVAYGTRAAQKLECVPLDTRLQLPQSVFSYVLQDWNGQLSVENPYGQVNRVLSKLLGFVQPVDSLERINVQAAEAVAAWREAKPLPKAEEEGEYLVVSADGKGVPIRRSADEPAIAEHIGQRGPKPNRKKMAIVGSVYTVDAVLRTAEEVVESLFRTPEERGSEREHPRAKPCGKQVRAALSRERDGQEVNATEEVIGWLAEQTERRHPHTGDKTLVLMDGQPSLWEAVSRHMAADKRVEILDLLHVTPRLWEATHLFCPEGSQAALEFVKERLLRVLHGEVSTVIGGLRQMGTKRGLKGKRRERLDKLCNYLQKNSSRMRYDEYLAAGYPIASGVIEGACRHFVKDRMERAGMRWTVDRAQAMLDLRSTYLNGDWDKFTTFRIKRETARLYPHRELLDGNEWPVAA
ncbi:MAG: ISKra4 family transposase [Gammaproteobacteria bacterium]|nr:ISKra4 family transposase [Gammaproteobacteria bacterium]